MRASQAVAEPDSTLAGVAASASVDCDMLSRPGTPRGTGELSETGSRAHRSSRSAKAFHSLPTCPEQAPAQHDNLRFNKTFYFVLLCDMSPIALVEEPTLGVPVKIWSWEFP